MIATREDLLHILTRYEGAVQRAQDEIGEDAADRELTEAREDLMRVLQTAHLWRLNECLIHTPQGLYIFKWFTDRREFRPLLDDELWEWGL